MTKISIGNLLMLAVFTTFGTCVYHYFFRALPDWMTVMDISFGAFSLVLNAWLLTKLGFFDSETVEDILETSKG